MNNNETIQGKSGDGMVFKGNVVTDNDVVCSFPFTDFKINEEQSGFYIGIESTTSPIMLTRLTKDLNKDHKVNILSCAGKGMNFTIKQQQLKTLNDRDYLIMGEAKNTKEILESLDIKYRSKY